MISRIQNCFDAGYYSKVLDLVQILESNNETDLDLIEILEMMKFMSKIELNEDYTVENIKSLYEDVINQDKVGIAATCLYFIYCSPEVSKDEKYEVLTKMKQLYLKKFDKSSIIDTYLIYMYLIDGDFQSALSLTNESLPKTKILRVFIYCLMNRYDLAHDIFNRILETYSDNVSNTTQQILSMPDFKESVVVRIAEAWIQCLKGDYNSAFVTLANIQTDFGGNSTLLTKNKSDSTNYVNYTDKDYQSCIILNSTAVIHMQRQHWSEALELLQIAYKLNPKSADTLSNLISCCYFLNKPEEAEHYFSEMQVLNNNYEKVLKINLLDKAFQT
ncbi:coatomer epsilon subunit family protein [Cryptosporidium andersoni]|uniref:Coatomer epsilon subunit family protein n=1 Tax=Cryptosporidium andersoni TaxID=117008 RepID=A0A1J4MQC5_9CRYT|nr:coatomer epsilon subunit family protein [Cryptosporidium andersoni]